jgi:cytidylate kinase
MTTDEEKGQKGRAAAAGKLFTQSVPSSVCGRPVRPLYDDLPKQLVVAIDGTAQAGKNTVGEIVAETIGGVLVDSDRVYRALAKACLEAGVDLEDRQAIIQFCRDASLTVRMDWDGGKVKEAVAFIDGRFFAKDELKSVAALTWKLSDVHEVREAANKALRLCACYGRIVMVGHDIGGVVFPNSSFKFFLDAPGDVREQRHFRELHSYGAVRRDHNEDKQLVFAEDALMIDTGNLEPHEVSGIILIEVFWGADERKILRQLV